MDCQSAGEGRLHGSQRGALEWKKEKEIEKSAIRERASVPSGVIISLK